MRPDPTPVDGAGPISTGLVRPGWASVERNGRAGSAQSRGALEAQIGGRCAARIVRTVLGNGFSSPAPSSPSQTALKGIYVSCVSFGVDIGRRACFEPLIFRDFTRQILAPDGARWSRVDRHTPSPSMIPEGGRQATAPRMLGEGQQEPRRPGGQRATPESASSGAERFSGERTTAWTQGGVDTTPQQGRREPTPQEQAGQPDHPR